MSTGSVIFFFFFAQEKAHYCPSTNYALVGNRLCPNHKTLSVFCKLSEIVRPVNVLADRRLAYEACTIVNLLVRASVRGQLAKSAITNEPYNHWSRLCLGQISAGRGFAEVSMVKKRAWVMLCAHIDTDNI